MRRLALGLLLMLLASSAFATGVEWTSATAQHAVLSIPLAKGSTVALTFNPNGSITGGVLTFEAIDDNSQAYPISLARVDTLAVEGTFALNAAAKQAWQGRLTGFASFQVRLSSVITGTGTANINVVVSPIASGGPVATSSSSITPGTSASSLGKAEDSPHTSGDTGVMFLGVRKDTSTQSTNADADYSAPAIDAYSALFARSDHPNRIACTVLVSTATTIQAIGSSCAAPGAGLSIYITDIEFGSSAASGTAADSFPTLKTGTGGTCGTATAVIWQALTAANTTQVANYTVPRKVPANSELCWIMTTAGSKTVQINGFIAP